MYDPSLNINEVIVYDMLRYREASLTPAAETSRDWYLVGPELRLLKFEEAHSSTEIPINYTKQK